jgi:biotin synthase
MASVCRLSPALASFGRQGSPSPHVDGYKVVAGEVPRRTEAGFEAGQSISLRWLHVDGYTSVAIGQVGLTETSPSGGEEVIPRGVYEGGLPTEVELAAGGRVQEELHAQAAALTRTRFGRQVFVRAVVEVSNYCRENCSYCGMRRDNRSLDRFRARHDELAELLIHHRPASVTDINIQTGEDPVAARELILPLVRTLLRETTLGISLCLGTLAHDLTRELQAAGATTYIIKFELADAADYARFQAPGTLEEREAHIRWLAAEGWHVSSGFIAGLPGQGAAALLGNFRLAASLPLVGCSVSPFVPGEATPLVDAPAGSLDRVLNSMAALRRMRPDWVIPAVSALNLAGPGDGYRRGLQTGANLCTINLTPDALREDYLLYRRDRFIMNEERILQAIAAEGLEASRVGLGVYLDAQRTRPGQGASVVG